MKQTKLITIIALMTVALVSCESYPEELTTKQVFNFEVKAKDWVEMVDKGGLNRYYTYKFKLKDLHPNTSFEHCAVLAYISEGNLEQPLPYTRHYENTEKQLWTTTVDFAYSLDEINFYVTSSDFARETPATMNFRIIYIW